MKHIINMFLFLLLTVIIVSCSSIQVATDYDKKTNFNTYKTFAFFKPGIDQAKINSIDKRRILRAIETQLLNKGLTLSKNPDLLISLFTESTERVNVYNNTWGYGAWGWGVPYGAMGPGWGWGWNQPMVSTSVEGQLFIDLIDAKNKELVWQGMGTGVLTQNMNKKEQLINEFVAKIMQQFPPEVASKK